MGLGNNAYFYQSAKLVIKLKYTSKNIPTGGFIMPFDIKRLEMRPGQIVGPKPTESQIRLYEVCTFREGKLMNSKGIPLDTRKMASHDKNGYAAYVLTDEGKLFIFNHLGTKSSINHSSFTQGQAVWGAGELVVIEGKLKIINTHSGHYKPSLSAVNQILTILEEKKVDTSSVEVETFDDPGQTIPTLKSRPRRIDIRGLTVQMVRFYTPAQEIKNLVKNIEAGDLKLKKFVDRLNSQEDNLFTQWLRFIDRMFSFREELTLKRNYLRKEASIMLRDFSSHTLSSEKGVDSKISLVTALIEQNSQLSIEYGKSYNSGRLHQVLQGYKGRLETIKKELAQEKSNQESLIKIR